ncbi:MAG: peptide chain release factor N(5)-glutamine methyltransferase [Acidimicrobiia bacterium]
MSPDEPVTWAGLRAEAVERLRRAGRGSPEADVRWLVERAAADPAGPVTERAAGWFEAMLARREAGEPLQYVLGSWAFRTLDLFVDPRVLIPRPETEVVAGCAIDELRSLGGTVAADLGTGSGAIALSIAVEVPTAEVWAVDRSAAALEVARANLAGVGRPARRVRIVEGDWFDGLPGELRGRLDVVVANPPYVATGDPLPDEVAGWEPSEALLAGADGLDDLRRIVADAPAWLARPGTLVVECAPHQATAVAELAGSAGFDDVDVRHDYTGRERFVRARLTGR